MTLIKHDIPILERDTEQIAVIMANRHEDYVFPKKCVFAFLGEMIEQVATKEQHEVIGEFESITKIYPIYKMNYKGEEVCYVQAPCGAAPAVQILEFLIGYGVEEIIACGSCGGLKHFEENHILIPTVALRDEGTSYHYIEPSRDISLSEKAIRACTQAAEHFKILHTLCKTWTTDGFFRETKEMIAYRKEEGCQVVEMECSALMACAQFRGIEFGQILFTADSLAIPEAYDERDWGRSSYEIVFQLALEAAYLMDKV
nr:nucleoside phosphorylase [uncultured Niameybacter sp.]